jgi:uncharacterized protein YjaG (DUF416 family)
VIYNFRVFCKILTLKECEIYAWVKMLLRERMTINQIEMFDHLLDSQSNKDYATRIWHGAPTSYYMGNAISRVIS